MTTPTDLAQALRELTDACEAEYCSADTDGEGDDSKVAFPEESCSITFGMIRRARAALNAQESRQPEVKPVYVLDRYGFPVGASQYRLERMADGYWTPWHIAQQTLSETIARMQYQFDKALESRARAQPASVSDEVSAALDVVNDAANDARHRGDYDRANALVKARIALRRAAQPASVGDGWATTLREADELLGDFQTHFGVLPPDDKDDRVAWDRIEKARKNLIALAAAPQPAKESE